MGKFQVNLGKFQDVLVALVASQSERWLNPVSCLDGMVASRSSWCPAVELNNRYGSEVKLMDVAQRMRMLRKDLGRGRTAVGLTPKS